MLFAWGIDQWVDYSCEPELRCLCEIGLDGLPPYAPPSPPSPPSPPAPPPSCPVCVSSAFDGAAEGGTYTAAEGQAVTYSCEDAQAWLNSAQATFGCDEGRELWAGRCCIMPPSPPSPPPSRFTFHPGPVSWVEAAAGCTARGGALAVLRTQEESAAAYATLVDDWDGESFSRVAYFALSDHSVEGQWAWANGSALGAFHPWADGEPNSYNGVDEDCAGFIPNYSDRWYDLPCRGDLSEHGQADVAVGYLCQDETGEPDEADACPDGWQRHGAKCYRLDGRGSQAACQEQCANAGLAAGPSAPPAGLVCLESADEEAFVVSAFAGDRSCCHWPVGDDQSSDQTCCTWIGLYQDPDADHGTSGDAAGGWTHWRKPGCTSTYRDWTPGEPNQYGGYEEDCAMLFAWGIDQWVDHPCEPELRCLCEIAAHTPSVHFRPPSPPSPPSPPAPPPSCHVCLGGAFNGAAEGGTYTGDGGATVTYSCEDAQAWLNSVGATFDCDEGRELWAGRCCIMPPSPPAPPPAPPHPPHAPFPMPVCVAAAAPSEAETIVLSYHDHDNVDDVPDFGSEIAGGFSSESSFYIGNAALDALDIAHAEMCLWYGRAADACTRNCVPLTNDDFVYEGHQLDALRSNTHRVIALMSGQLEHVTPGTDYCASGNSNGGVNGATATTAWCPHAPFYPRHIGVDAGAGPARECPSCWTCRYDASDPLEATIRGFDWGWHAWGYGVVFSRVGGWDEGDGNNELSPSGHLFDCADGHEIRWEGFYVRVVPVAPPSVPPSLHLLPGIALLPRCPSVPLSHAPHVSHVFAC